ncbi:MAG: Mut7-C RNAse domain-containing protein, partial [Nitrososphaeraceae archaeon]
MRSAEPKYKVRAYSPSFLVDAMLGNIARKLRIFGYDTLYLKDTPDTSVLEIASREKRVLLTRD